MPLPTGLPLIVTLCGGAVKPPDVPFNPKITVCPGTDGTVPAGIPDRVFISCGWCQCSVPDLSDLVIPLKFYCSAIPGTVAVVGERDFSRKPAAVGHGWCSKTSPAFKSLLRSVAIPVAVVIEPVVRITLSAAHRLPFLRTASCRLCM